MFAWSLHCCLLRRRRGGLGRERGFWGIALTSTFSSTSTSLLSENLQLHSLFWMFIFKYVSFLFTFDLMSAKQLFCKVSNSQAFLSQGSGE